MPSPRPFALVRTLDQWLRCSHEQTAIDPETGGVLLAWEDPDPVDAAEPAPLATPGGLGFDCRCRLYRSVPDQGRVERWPWSPEYTPRRGARPELVFQQPEGERAGDFRVDAESHGPLGEPRGVAVDADDRLFVADAGRRAVVIADLRMQRIERLVRMVDALGPGFVPVDLAAHGSTVWLLATGPEPALLRFDGGRGPWRAPLPDGVTDPTRVEVAPESGRVLLLDSARSEDARVVAVDGSLDPLEVPWATDLAMESEEVLVVARRPGDDFVRFRRLEGRIVSERPLKATGYDGAAIARTPDGRIAYFAGDVLRHAVTARRRHETRGRVTTFRLDAGDYQNLWGRLLLDACIPAGSAVRAWCAATDEPEEPSIPRGPAEGIDDPVPRRPDLSPPTMPEPLAPGRGVGRWQPLHRRATGTEQPWLPDDGRSETYEAPIDTPPGRYLWVALELTGNVRTTPRIRSVRAETVSHDWLGRLPAAFAREPRAALFLQRYLGMLDSVLGDVDARTTRRAMLADPFATPEELLPWLASFVGLALDRRWPLDRRRRLVSEAAELFRMRGTIWGLSRFLELYIDRPVMLIEHYRFRAVRSVLSGAGPTLETAAVVGSGLRVGGRLGRDSAGARSDREVEDAFATHAHRFTVLVHGTLDDEQMAVVEHILEVHRPAHTLFAVCTVGAGMRVGRGLHVGLSSMVGRSGGFASFELGGTALGPMGMLGRPALDDRRLGRERLG